MGKDTKRKRDKKRFNKILKKLKREIESYDSSSSGSTSTYLDEDSDGSGDRDSVVDYTHLGELASNRIVSGEVPGPSIDGVYEILGADPLMVTKMGPPIHQEIASRWSAFLRNGVDKIERKELVEKYPINENCLALQAPKLNLEVQCCLSDSALKQDNYIMRLQGQLGASIAAIAIPTNEFFSLPSEATNRHLPHLVNSAKLLTDIYHSLSSHRRYTASNSLEPSLRKVIEESPIDEWLFGGNLAVRLKDNQEVKKAGAELKPRRAVSHVTKMVNNKSPKTSYFNFRRQMSRRQKEEGSRTWRKNRREVESRSVWRKKEAKRR